MLAVLSMEKVLLPQGLVLKPRMSTFRPIITEHFGFWAMHFMQRKIIL